MGQGVGQGGDAAQLPYPGSGRNSDTFRPGLPEEALGAGLSSLALQSVRG